MVDFELSQESETSQEFVSGGEAAHVLRVPFFILLRRYIALTKPERTLTNVVTALAGYFLASRFSIAWGTLAALLVGSSLIIASACVLNNIIDRDLDQKMARTKTRALVTGQIAARSALLYAAVLGVAGFWILAYTNWLTFGVGMVAFIGYVVLYDVAKRLSVHGTLVGTVPGAASLVAGYTAVVGRLDTTVLLLFIIMLAWQMAHFYSIAIYRLKDYQKAGVPVWPAKYGIANTKVWITAYVVLFLAANMLLSIFGPAGIVYAIVLALLSLEWLRRGLQGWRRSDNNTWARSMFGFSLVVVLTLSVMLAVGSTLP